MNASKVDTCIHGRTLASRRDNPCRDWHPGCSTQLSDTRSLLRNPLTLQQRAPAFEPDGSGDPYTLTGDTVRVPFEDAIAYATQRARRTGARQLVKRSFPTHTNELAKMYDVQAWR